MPQDQVRNKAYYCPLTLGIMRDAVMDPEGNLYLSPTKNYQTHHLPKIKIDLYKETLYSKIHFN